MIQVLEKGVADKIAAGEVVDRPLSIVKELVENSIDAGATSITVEIKKGGKSYIRVTDNGCGIPADQVETAFLRHATSKISQAADLEHIETLGFRGEALASVSAVSRTEIITKTADAKTGTRMAIEGSQIVEKEVTGCPEGTTIVVRDLFYNTPARKKFMRSDAAESGSVIEFVSHITLAYARIRIRMINNGSMLFSTPGNGKLYSNILTVFSRDIGDQLIPVGDEVEELKLEGYISSPGQSRPTRRHQIFFVNGRVVDSKVIQKGVSNAYADKLFEGRFPIAILFLRFPSDRLDVNIHPNKREVRFHDEGFVVEWIQRALREALLSKESIPAVKQEDLFRKPETIVPLDTRKPKVRDQEKQVNVKQLLSTLRKEEEPYKTSASQVKEETRLYQTAAPLSPDAQKLDESSIEQSQVQTPATPPPFDFEELTITGTIFDTYITAIDGDSFYLIDQHAAHERIFFEKLMAQYRNQETHSQPIMFPIMLNVSHSADQNAEDWLTALSHMGFCAEPFGPRTYAVKSISMFMGLEEARCFLKDFADSLGDGKLLDNLPLIEKITMRSCKSAVKAHDHLRDSEIRQLIQDLRQCENPFSCPHGRPTFIKMTQYEIEKMFKRV
ncbi:MAG: DNA mismatch repair endonuclease MutL [Firmicutes bacterium]|jgi:DNA mismatch repair protein MutL|nr:DNA mismatch repair endonuclease MutL [Bacillota bacterium]